MTIAGRRVSARALVAVLTGLALLAATGCRPQPEASDFDGDGKTDIVIMSGSSQVRWTRHVRGQAPTEIVGPVDGSSITGVPGSYDGSPGLDPAWITATGDWVSKGEVAPISFPHGPETSIPGSMRYFQIPVPGYYDGGTKTIPAWYDEFSATWAIMGHEPEVFGSGPTDPLHVPAASRCGSPSIDQDWPVPADYDGDKKTDLAVYNQTTGRWRIRQSFDGTERALELGGPRSYPAPADYDGDGKVDPAVLDVAGPTMGTWRIDGQPDRTFPGALAARAQSVPAPADYVGDDAVDLAVFDRLTGEFIVGVPTWWSPTTTFVPPSTSGGETWPVVLPNSMHVEMLRGAYIAGFCP